MSKTKTDITIKMRKSTHAAVMEQLRAARQVYGEQLSLAGWLDKLIEWGLTKFEKENK